MRILCNHYVFVLMLIALAMRAEGGTNDHLPPKIIDSSSEDNKTRMAEGWHTEKPPYPFKCRALHEQGHMDVVIITGANGRVVNASLPKSKDHPNLDLSTARWAYLKWYGPPNHKLTVPVTYILR